MRLLAIVPQGYYFAQDVFNGSMTQPVVDSNGARIVDDQGRRIITHTKRNYFVDHFGRRLVTDAGERLLTER